MPGKAAGGAISWKSKGGFRGGGDFEAVEEEIKGINKGEADWLACTPFILTDMPP